MSLIAWFPLNGNLNNQGTGDYTLFKRSPTYELGKVTENSLQFLEGKQQTYFSNPFAELDHWSFAFWYKANTPAIWSDIFTFTSGKNRLEFSDNSGASLTWYNDNITYGAPITSGSIIKTGLSSATWYHLCITYNTGTSTVYLNGKQVFQQNGGTNLTKDDKNKIYLASRINMNYAAINLNDIRCYDHALSIKEVKELSKGLCLHYAMNFEDLYEPVEYIESTGEQYIDTGVTFNALTDIIETQYYIPDAQGGENIAFGYCGPNVTYALYQCANTYVIGDNAGYISTGKTAKPGNIHTFKYHNTTVECDGIAQKVDKVSSSNGYNIYIGCGNYSGTAKVFTANGTKYYSFKILNNESLIRNFIPCIRRLDGKPGLYDLVENKFYTNQGAGREFVTPKSVRQISDWEYDKGPTTTGPIIFIQKKVFLERNKKYLIQFDAKHDGNAGQYQNIEVDLYLDAEHEGGPQANFFNNNGISNKWKTFTTYFYELPNEQVEYCYFRMFVDQPSEGYYVNVSKIECKNIRIVELGINDDTGYGHNGIVNDLKETDPNAHLGNLSVKWDNDFEHNLQANINPSFLTSEWTLCMWVKNNKPFLLANSNDTSSHYLMAMDKTDERQIWSEGVDNVSYYIDGKNITETKKAVYDGDWHFYAVAGESLKGWNALYFNKHDSNWTIDGEICDIKLYATWLSDDDIKELYNDKFILTNNYRLYGNIEEDDYKGYELNKNGILSTTNITEVNRITDTSIYGGYTLLEYIESTGTQWIDTKIKIQSMDSFEIKFDLMSGFIFGQNDQATTKNPYIQCNNNNGDVGTQLCSVSKYSTNNTHTYYVSSVNDPFNGTLGLFCTLYTYPLVYATGKIYSFKYFRGNEIMRDFVPVIRNSDGEIGLYDLVGNKFYENKGSGVFKAGPVKSAETTQLTQVKINEIIEGEL